VNNLLCSKNVDTVLMVEDVNCR